MRNLLFFILFLIGLYYVRRALGGKSGGAGRAPDEGGKASSPPREPTHAAEQMVPCAHCGVHVPESEALQSGDRFFCSEEHRRLGPRQ